MADKFQSLPNEIPLEDIAFGVLQREDGVWTVASFAREDLPMLSDCILEILGHFPELKRRVAHELLPTIVETTKENQNIAPTIFS